MRRTYTLAVATCLILVSILVVGTLPSYAQEPTATFTPTDTETPTLASTAASTETATPTITFTPSVTPAARWVATLSDGKAVGTVEYQIDAGQIVQIMIGLVQMVLLAFIAFLLMIQRRQ